MYIYLVLVCKDNGIACLNTQEINMVLDDECDECINDDDASDNALYSAQRAVDDLQKYDNLIFGASTWEIGELQEDWESFIDVLEDVDYNGKTVAFFGTGDADGYPDTFVDALGIIYERIADSGAKFIGQVDPDEYTFDESRAIIDGTFIGLPIDEDNEPDLTDGRLEKWANQIKGEL